MPGIAPAHGIAAVSSVGYFGMMIGPPMIGFIAQAQSLRLGLLVVIAFAVVVTALCRRALGTGAAGARASSTQRGAGGAQPATPPRSS